MIINGRAWAKIERGVNEKCISPWSFLEWRVISTARSSRCVDETLAPDWSLVSARTRTDARDGAHVSLRITLADATEIAWWRHEEPAMQKNVPSPSASLGSSVCISKRMLTSRYGHNHLNQKLNDSHRIALLLKPVWKAIGSHEGKQCELKKLIYERFSTGEIMCYFITWGRRNGIRWTWISQKCNCLNRAM